MKRKMLFAAVIVLSISAGLLASITSGIIAYPVPYNPDRGIMQIADQSGTLTGVTKVEVTIMDINGDQVFNRIYPGLSGVAWNGRNSSGSKVRPGFYMVKVEVEDVSGFRGSKVIRILVNY
ncbi:MAG: hypothetical protein JXA20_06160 [Spirochaetes bacterium]|nr:hypothetical protein [Spirochaetota bacterium]